MLTPEVAKLHKLLDDIAFFLNVGEQSPVWVHSIPADQEKANYPSQDITHTSNPEIYLNVRIGTYGVDKNRVCVSGNFHIRQGTREAFYNNERKQVPNISFYDPRNYDESKVALPSITCGAAKTPEQIAKDIKRRLLPEYLPLIKRAIEKRDETERFYSDARSKLEKLAKIVGYETKLARLKSSEDRHVIGYSSDGAYADITTDDKGITDLNISNLTFEQAQRVLAIVAEKHANIEAA